MCIAYSTLGIVDGWWEKSIWLTESGSNVLATANPNKSGLIANDDNDLLSTNTDRYILRHIK